MSIERTQIPGGVRVLTETMPGQRSASLGVWVGSGSRDEGAADAGASHFLEHLVFKGTAGISALEIAQRFDAAGADLNAFTTKEVTCFHTRVLVDDLPMAVEVIGDMVERARLAEEDLEAERGVVLDEIAMHEDTPDDIIYDVFHEAMWSDHPLGRRVQGTAASVGPMTREHLDGYRRSHYTPSNIVVSAAGSLEHELLVDLCERHLSTSGAPRPPRVSADPPADAAVVVQRRDIEQVHLVYGTRGIPRADERRWALGVLNVALGSGMSSRLFQEIRERRGLAYAVGSGHLAFSDTGAFTIYAGCSPSHAREVLAIARDVVADVAANGIAAEELERAVGHLRGLLLISLDDSASLMSHIGRAEIGGEPLMDTAAMIARVEQVTLADVAAAASSILGDAWSLAVLGARVDADLSTFAGAAA